MGPKRVARDHLASIVLLDVSLQNSTLGQAFVSHLSETLNTGDEKITCHFKPLDIPNSVQWLTRRDESCNEWQTEKIVLVFVPFSSFHPSPGFLNRLSIPSNDDASHVKILLVLDKKRSQSRVVDKGLEAEVKRLEREKAFAFSTECLALHSVDLSLDPLDERALCTVVERTTRSVVDAAKLRITTDESMTWYPKKTGPPVLVAKNKVGLANLWQRYLMQISKGINVEVAKCIAADPAFASMQQCMQSFGGHGGENMAVGLTSGTSDRLRTAKQSVGVETSRKVCQVFTSRDGEKLL